MGEEEYKEIRLRLPTQRSSGTDGKDCVELIRHQHELLAPTVTRFQLPRLQLMNAH